MNRELNLKDLADAIRKRLLRIVLIGIVSLLCGGAIGYFVPPSYSAQTELLVNSSTGLNPSMSDIDTNIRLIETYKRILKSDRMASKLASALDFPFTQGDLAKKVKVKSDEGSQIITVSVYGPSHEQTATLLNTYVDLFREEVRTLMNLENITVLKEVEAGLDTKYLSNQLVFYIILPFLVSQAAYFTKIIWTEIHSPLFDSERKVERAFQLPLLGAIHTTGSTPSLNALNPKTKLYNVTRAAAPDFGRLAANFHHMARQRKMKTFLITSPAPGDGKSFIGGHLAVALALDGKRTLFIDANLRNPAGYAFFDLSERKGLTSVISGHFNLEEVLQKTGVNNLTFLSTGPLPQNPASYFLSEQMERLLADLEALFDVLIVDSSDLTVADAFNLMPLVDGCLFITDAKKTTESEAVAAFKSVYQVNGHIIGTVLNKMKKPKR
ncbi:polysaccharide biosynthesis tyrosine autokinase [Sporosarcina sp. 179-K 3D1 HS]|uniref:polysaccharide biosynthesis tyrosine autokinase n=1 Tax=Sporosarcina sp. 179-K 3D1 HS TaxID=3232169 RepID=UPI00399F36A0